MNAAASGAVLPAWLCIAMGRHGAQRCHAHNLRLEHPVAECRRTCCRQPLVSLIPQVCRSDERDSRGERWAVSARPLMRRHARARAGSRAAAGPTPGAAAPAGSQLARRSGAGLAGCAPGYGTGVPRACSHRQLACMLLAEQSVQELSVYIFGTSEHCHLSEFSVQCLCLCL